MVGASPSFADIIAVRWHFASDMNARNVDVPKHSTRFFELSLSFLISEVLFEGSQAHVPVGRDLTEEDRSSPESMLDPLKSR